jgi:hypothetical protein
MPPPLRRLVAPDGLVVRGVANTDVAEDQGRLVRGGGIGDTRDDVLEHGVTRVPTAHALVATTKSAPGPPDGEGGVPVITRFIVPAS